MHMYIVACLIHISGASLLNANYMIFFSKYNLLLLDWPLLFIVNRMCLDKYTRKTKLNFISCDMYVNAEQVDVEYSLSLTCRLSKMRHYKLIKTASYHLSAAYITNSIVFRKDKIQIWKQNPQSQEISFLFTHVFFLDLCITV